jgi:hypothetical protein
MKTTIFSALLLAGALGAAGADAPATLRIGVLNLEDLGENPKAAAEATNHLQHFIAEQGQIEIFTQEKIVTEVVKLGKTMPSHCRDPRCVLDLGSMLTLDRMIYGAVDVNEKRCAIHLHQLDMWMRQATGEASVEGAPGAPLDSVLRTALAVLNGKADSTRTVLPYFGPAVHHEKQMLYSSVCWAGAGLIWALVNYNQAKGSPSYGYEQRSEGLSGIPSSADQIPMFARPAALANAYVAASDDAYGVLYNPAGTAWVAGPEAIVGYQYRFGFDNIAASYVNKATREIGFGEAFLYSGDQAGLLRELYFVTAASYKFNRLLPFLRPLSIGADFKVVSETSFGDTSTGNGSSFGVGIDLGLLWELNDRIRYGLLLRDLPVVNRWRNSSTGERYFEALATTLHMGGTYKVGYTTFLIAEGQIPVYADQPWKMSGGIEQELFRVLVARVGLQKQIQSSYDTPWKITGGFGLKVDTEPVIGTSFCLDGSYEYSTLEVFPVVNVSFKIGF